MKTKGKLTSAIELNSNPTYIQFRIYYKYIIHGETELLHLILEFQFANDLLAVLIK